MNFVFAKGENGFHLRILEENHYYPFGLKHENYNVEKKRVTWEPTMSIVGPVQTIIKEKRVRQTNNSGYQYKYNGKEWQDELGLNFYDFGFRNYDPAIGRWMNIDPLAERRYELNPYNYVQNSPLFRFDPDGLTDFTLNKKTGEVEMIEGTDDKEGPDRILKTNRKGEVKEKGKGFLGFLVSKSERGKEKVAIDNIEKGILQDGQNLRYDDTLIHVGGVGQPSVEGVEKFALQLSSYIGREIGGTYFSKDGVEDITHMTIGKYVNNTYRKNESNGSLAIRKLCNSLDLSAALAEFKSYQFRGFLHTHPNEPGRFNSSKEDKDFKNRALKHNPNLFFFIITHPEPGGNYPAKIDYTND